MAARDDDLALRKLPRQLRSKATVDAIFEAAMQVLDKADQGDPSVKTIADRAGVSVGSLYQYFPTKDALISALIRLHLQQRVEDLKERFAAAKRLPGEEAARALVNGLVQVMRPRIGIERAMMRSFVRVGDLESLTSMDGEMLALVEDFIRGLGDQARPVDVPLAAFLVMNALRSAMLLSVLQNPERLDDPKFTEELTRLVVGYLRSEAKRE